MMTVRWRSLREKVLTGRNNSKEAEASLCPPEPDLEKESHPWRVLQGRTGNLSRVKGTPTRQEAKEPLKLLRGEGRYPSPVLTAQQVTSRCETRVEVDLGEEGIPKVTRSSWQLHPWVKVMTGFVSMVPKSSCLVEMHSVVGEERMWLMVEATYASVALFNFLEVILEGKTVVAFLDLLSTSGLSLVSVLHLVSVLCSMTVAVPNLKRIL